MSHSVPTLSAESTWRCMSPQQRNELVVDLKAHVRHRLLSLFASLAPHLLEVIQSCLTNSSSVGLFAAPVLLYIHFSLTFQQTSSSAADVVRVLSSWTPIALRLPLEVWFLILDDALRCAHPGSLFALRLRGRLMPVCKTTEVVVRSYKPLWSVLRVSPQSTYNSIHAFLRQVTGQSFGVVVVDGRYTWPDETTRIARVRSAFDVCIHSTSHWSSLTVLSPYPSTVHYVFGLLRGKELPALKEVYVNAPVDFIQRDLRLDSSVTRHPQNLIRLDLRAVGQYGLGFVGYTALRFLCLVDLPTGSWPSVAGFCDFLRSATSLEELELRRVGLRGAFPSRPVSSSISPQELITLPSLRSLKLLFDNRYPEATLCLYPLIERLVLPSLSSLLLEFRSDPELVQYRTFGPRLCAPYVQIRGYLREQPLLEYLYSTLGSCEHLDLWLLGGIVCLKALGTTFPATLASRTIFMPNLTTLSLANRDWGYIHSSLLERAARGRRVKLLRVVVPFVQADLAQAVPLASWYDFQCTSEVVSDLVWVERRPVDVYTDVRRI
ncbi:hypothetical protein R3P38DRAFT_3217784 [Favolaschia claudopus]|uniref:F-box domain-containing protein n=1 Tax=Favolaschia claudopus TaxID=2862362 RepID=A0AAW0A4G9_9AGAR